MLNKPRNGKWKEFNRYAILIAEGNYLNDVKQGIWKQYYDNGELIFEEMYDNGVLHGQFKSYHSNGNVMSHGQYVHGSREGLFYVYDEQNTLIKILLFDNNVLLKEIAIKDGIVEQSIEEVEIQKSNNWGLMHL
jgi:antitoxin component YwqK of YwqJK toxin-antitoxin module